MKRPEWNKIIRSVRAMQKPKIEQGPLTSSLVCVFAQLESQNIGKRATGFEYVPNRSPMTRAERGRARQALRANLSASLNLCASESTVLKLPDAVRISLQEAAGPQDQGEAGDRPPPQTL